jgi:hypothetical protein
MRKRGANLANGIRPRHRQFRTRECAPITFGCRPRNYGVLRADVRPKVRLWRGRDPGLHGPSHLRLASDNATIPIL